MDIAVRDRFMTLWRKYFDKEELPLAFFYTDRETDGPLVTPSQARRCMVSELARAREGGETLRFGAGSFGCLGGRRYAGFSDHLRPKFEYFLSCGIPGEMEGERYKKTPELVRELLARAASFRAPKRYLVVKRWDTLAAEDDPEVAVFFARPDALSGLFTLSGYDSADDEAVIAPFGAGCGTIIQRPYLERERPTPRAVLGLFDVSARPSVPADTLTFAVPYGKLLSMMNNMDESFLITESWAAVRKRLAADKR
jgi:hypothetical protein